MKIRLVFARYLSCFCALAALLFGGVLEAAVSTTRMLDRVVATVNSEAISESELNRQLDLLTVRLKESDVPLPPIPVLRKQLLEKMVLEKLQLQMAKAVGITIDDKTLSETIKGIADQDNLSVSQLQGFLEGQGVPFKKFKESINNDLTISRLQQREILAHLNVSEMDIEHFMKSGAGQDKSGTEYRLSHILIPFTENKEAMAAETEAKNVIARLNKGDNFGQIAVEKSKGSQALNGGDLGFRRISDLPTLFVTIAPTLKVGEIHGPIKTENGFHIIKLVEKRNQDENGKILSPETRREQAREAILRRKFEEAVASWLRRIRDEAQIEMYLAEAD